MFICSILHSKGGCAKTTTTAELAAAFAVRGLRVLAVDTDPQGSLTHFLTEPGATPYAQIPDENCITALLDDLPDPDRIVRKLETMPNLSLLPANANFKRCHDTPPAERGARLLYLYDFLRELRARFDVALIDVAPELPYSASLATAASDFVLTPTPPADLDIFALPQVKRHLDEANLARDPARPPLAWLGLLLSKVQANNVHATARGFLMGSYPQLALTPPGKFMPVEVPLMVAFSEAVRYHKPLGFTPKCKGAKVFSEVAAEVARRTGLTLREPEQPAKPATKPHRRAA